MTTITMAPPRLLGRTAPEWLISLPTISLLLLILLIGTGEMIHGQLLKFGEIMFHDDRGHVQYFMMRADPVRPTCNPSMNVEAEVARLQAARAQKSAPDDDIDDLFAEQAMDPAMLRQAVVSTVAQCQSRHALYEQVVKHITPVVVAYRTVETSFFGLFSFGSENRPLILLLLLTVTSIATTLGFHHICLRPPKFVRDFRMQAITMSIASALLFLSAVQYHQVSVDAGVPLEAPWMYYLWMLLFGVLMAISVYRVAKPVTEGTKGLGTWAESLQSIPLFASMGIISGVYFLLHNHPSGLAIYVSKLMDIPNLPLQLALYIWAGMLLKQSRLVDLFMNTLRPWKFSPELLTYLILLAAALPTAYSGASGVFVIAAGAIIYHEVRAVGGSSQYALAATAMSGSLGVVLRPSLLVVGITMLNKEVTSDQLFHWGGYVFVLTSTMFFIASQMRRTQRVNIESPKVALPEMLRQIVPLLPHVAAVIAVVGFYTYALETPLNEISAPTIIPVLMIVVLTLDKILASRAPVKASSQQPSYAAHRQDGVEPAIRAATTETVSHIGAYIGLMMLSQTVGGVVERSEIIDLAPHHFSSVWAAMAFLMIAKVVLGMFMEPIGAIFLVSGTLAPIAYRNGIDPVHFWMMVLVAFELGYLLPPVALNQLLTRQVVGEDEIDASDHEVQHASFVHRYERWLLPIAVMSISLVIVGFGPLIVQHVEWLRFLR
ncbi:TRAP transporter large permease subunit [Aquabacterium sp.]|uniref:TRAP transporter large permease subunit n=1 Tax=Aquabacterium sp. TaxID=1872578 RepID=UPI0024871E2E|nr:TRAP transporter large permease subunit [Aquabacterium sp.]MDI1259373.1 TRAP transporter large permease subunit [Aquabacterium sp.]